MHSRERVTLWESTLSQTWKTGLWLWTIHSRLITHAQRAIYLLRKKRVPTGKLKPAYKYRSTKVLVDRDYGQHMSSPLFKIIPE